MFRKKKSIPRIPALSPRSFGEQIRSLGYDVTDIVVEIFGDIEPTEDFLIADITLERIPSSRSGRNIGHPYRVVEPDIEKAIALYNLDYEGRIRREEHIVSLQLISFKAYDLTLTLKVPDIAL